MRWTSWIGLAAGLLAASGCAVGYRQVVYGAPYSIASRPHASYFCYDCHGYRYFDPYYDWCANYGYRYVWAAHPQVVRLYRERYVRIREQHPEYGRYRYPPGYRSSPRYRDERLYDDRWSGEPGTSYRSPAIERKTRDFAPDRRGHHKRDRGREERRESKERGSDSGGRGI